MKRVRGVWIVAVVVALAGSGCRPPVVATASAPASGSTVGEIVLTTPQDAVRSVLTVLRAQRMARVQRDRDAVKRYQEQLHATAAREVILGRFEAAVGRPAKNPDELVEMFVKSWGPLLGFYLDALQLDRIESPTPVGGADRVEVRVPVTSADRRTVIHIECSRGADEKWRVGRMYFEPTPATSRPATTSAP